MNQYSALLKDLPLHIKINEPLSCYTSFKIGGPADALLFPSTVDELLFLYSYCSEKSIPVFVLGEGANILVADKGIRGAVISLQALNKITWRDKCVEAEAGTKMSLLAEVTTKLGWQGLETFYTMPGSVGGSLYMNARCYGSSLSDSLKSVHILERNQKDREISPHEGDFGYKKSPFQSKYAGSVIISGTFELKKSTKTLGQLRMELAFFRQDRKRKGHFQFPSAGSVFKNNHQFGQPSGRIIDELGLKGYSIGGAQVSDFHANIIINRNKATAGEVRELIEYVKLRVKQNRGLELEEEVLYVGDWEDYHATANR